MKQNCYGRFLCILTVLGLALWSCRTGDGRPSEEWCESRDRTEHMEIVSIDEELPPLHSFTDLNIKGDTLLILDRRATDHLFVAYDIPKGEYLGSFGNYGDGPGEMANLGDVYLGPAGVLYATNNNHMKVQGVVIDRALQDSTYKAFDKVRLDTSEGLLLYQTPTYVNDTTVVCSLYKSGEDGYETHVGRFNPATGTACVLDTLSGKNIGKSLIAIDVDRNLVVAVGSTHDRVRIFDLDGNLKKTVYGPDFKEGPEKGVNYFSQPVIAGERIIANYLGKEIEDVGYGCDLIVMDLSGKYVKTLHNESPISGMAYHKGTNRLYVCTYGDPQFGYIQLDD